MKELEDVLERTPNKRTNVSNVLALGVSRGIITEEQATSLQCIK